MIQRDSAIGERTVSQGRGSTPTVITDFGYAVAVSRVEGGVCKTTLVEPPNRLLGVMRISLRTNQAKTTLHDVEGTPSAEFRWNGAIDLETANRALEAQHRSSVPVPDSIPCPCPTTPVPPSETPES